eukprot:COSAG01_NODE_1995_length_8691_cov_62.212989_9_plen_87_part_00
MRLCKGGTPSSYMAERQALQRVYTQCERVLQSTLCIMSSTSGKRPSLAYLAHLTYLHSDAQHGEVGFLPLHVGQPEVEGLEPVRAL